MKLVTLQQVEEFLRENPKEKLRVSEIAYFVNTNVFNNLNEKVEDAGSDIQFVYGGVALRRFSESHQGEFQATAFLHSADEALEVVRAFVALEHTLYAPGGDTMSQFKILKPMWLGGNRCVGLADHRISTSNTIEIMYKDKTGVRIYPHQYSMSGNELKKYPTQQFNANMPLLRVVPIVDLHVAVERPEV